MMDVVYVTLRSYFLYPYQQYWERNATGFDIRMNLINEPCGKPALVLQKFVGCDEPCVVKVILEVTKADILNLELIRNNIGTIRNYRKTI